ncbi:hypothetical protein N644_0737 [Lactiplantibacillus paraplantarum]|nr:hypothetical protein N644_0737 [Lactiplantibacillus paraplantarum]KRL51218.1 hypothetical protein FD48_GL001498 [Lactiplantibacillus paraplantarum DSM 10667]
MEFTKTIMRRALALIFECYQNNYFSGGGESADQNSLRLVFEPVRIKPVSRVEAD